MMIMMVAVAIVFILLSVTGTAIGGPQPLPNATVRCTETLDGLFYHYWARDPKHRKIGFFFSCGQIGGWGVSVEWNQCSCNTANACTDCYRWWDAVALESLASFGILTNSKRNSTVPNTIYAHSPYNGNWNATSGCTFIDDFLWYGIAYLRVYEWLKAPIWLNRSVELHDWAWKYGWDDPCGGVWWNNCDNQQFKDSITLLQLLHLSSKLAFLFPKNSTYLEGAEKIWNWFFSFDNGNGLMADNGLVSTGAVPERCCNSSSKDPFKKCHNLKIPGTSYNQGLLMSSAAYLYRATGNKTYLTTGIKALEAIIANYTTSEGIIIDEPRSYQTYSYDCWGASSDPGGDWYSFQGIFMVHLGYFIDLLKPNGSLPDDVFEAAQKFITLTSDSAWVKSAVWPPYNITDACNSNPNKQPLHPKFYWWWGQNQIPQIIPADPRIFFHKTQLRCVTVGNNTQIWQGISNDEGNCTNLCMDNVNCSKYLYNDDGMYSNIDCWLWSYNRSDHICHQGDYDFNVGIKRPVGGTCAGHCGSTTPIKTASGGVCYCDANCAKHLDCCLDYANECLPDKVPSCKGLCNKPTAQVVRGGGYCWCMAGCNPWYTDNNSDGSCCPDYNQVCQSITVPDCLDARSQGSAVNLFLAHMMVEMNSKKVN